MAANRTFEDVRVRLASASKMIEEGPVKLANWEGVDSELPIKVGIKPYHHGKVIDNR